MRKKRRAKEIESDFELNIASIIDCFTVLIAYLLLSASFISLGMLDVTVAAISSDEPSESKPDMSELNVTILVQKNNAVKVTIGGKKTSVQLIESSKGNVDSDTLEGFLKDFKTKNPTIEAAMVTGENETKYKQLVKTVETTSKILTKVALSADKLD